jgi:hypothetical protein
MFFNKNPPSGNTREKGKRDTKKGHYSNGKDAENADEKHVERQG